MFSSIPAPSLSYTTITIVIICTKIILSCRVSEFPCRGGLICLPLDKYCDGKDDCGDASDEPKFCTGKHYVNVYFKIFIILNYYYCIFDE